MNGRRLGVAAALFSALSVPSVASADETGCAIDVMDGLGLMRAGRLVEAEDAMRSAGAECKPAREHAADLAWRIPKVFLHVSGRARADVTLRVDGAVFDTNVLDGALRLNPGEHVFAARTNDGAERHTTFILAEGETKSVTIDFDSGRMQLAAPLAEPRSSSGGVSPIAWTGFGLATVAFAVGTGTALASMSKVRAVRAECIDTRCPPSVSDDLDSARTLSTISTVSFVTAAIGAGVGILGLTLWKESPKRESSARVNVGAASVGVAGTF